MDPRRSKGEEGICGTEIGHGQGALHQEEKPGNSAEDLFWVVK